MLYPIIFAGAFFYGFHRASKSMFAHFATRSTTLTYGGIAFAIWLVPLFVVWAIFGSNLSLRYAADEGNFGPFVPFILLLIAAAYAAASFSLKLMSQKTEGVREADFVDAAKGALPFLIFFVGIFLVCSVALNVARIALG